MNELDIQKEIDKLLIKIQDLESQIKILENENLRLRIEKNYQEDKITYLNSKTS